MMNNILGYPFIDLPQFIREDLARCLDMPTGPNWEMLAVQLGCSEINLQVNNKNEFTGE